MSPALVVVSGPPGVGKTTLARRLAGLLELPLYSRDAIKEAMFDSLGWSDRERSRVYGAASVAVLQALLTDCLGSGASCVTESNFRPAHANGDFQRLVAHTGASVVQVQCVSEGSVLVERFATRSTSGERHPGHGDHTNLDEFRAELLAGTYEPLALEGPVLTIDTTHFENQAAETLAKHVAALLPNRHPHQTSPHQD